MRQARYPAVRRAGSMNPGKGALPPMVFSSRDHWTTSRRSLQQRGAGTPATRNGWACAAAARRERKRRYGATIKDAMTAVWEAWDWACGKRLKAMIPTLLPASNMADCSLARRTVIVFWPSTPRPSSPAHRGEDRGERRQAAACPTRSFLQPQIGLGVGQPNEAVSASGCPMRPAGTVAKTLSAPGRPVSGGRRAALWAEPAAGELGGASPMLRSWHLQGRC
ncbi:hypothetical protein ABIB75_005901 [Bradyrhizobium sp. GM2.2]